MKLIILLCLLISWTPMVALINDMVLHQGKVLIRFAVCTSQPGQIYPIIWTFRNLYIILITLLCLLISQTPVVSLINDMVLHQGRVLLIFTVCTSQPGQTYPTIWTFRNLYKKLISLPCLLISDTCEGSFSLWCFIRVTSC